MVKIEERDKLMGILVKTGIGLREVEEFVMSEEGKLRNNKSNFKKKREIVATMMEMKLRDNRREGTKIRKTRNRLRHKIEETLGPNSRKYRAVMRSVRDNCVKLRLRLRKKNTKKAEFLKGKYIKKENPIEDLSKEDRIRYGQAEIFQEDCKMRPEEEQKPGWDFIWQRGSTADRNF